MAVTIKNGFRVVTGLDFVNAQDMRLQNPGISNAPSYEELKTLQITDRVKVCCNGEYFWTQVVHIDYDTLIARLETYPLRQVKLNYWDHVEYHKHHIFETQKS